MPKFEIVIRVPSFDHFDSICGYEFRHLGYAQTQAWAWRVAGRFNAQYGDCDGPDARVVAL